MKIVIINGPNLNRLGKRDARHYGLKTLDEINSLLERQAKSLSGNLELVFFQSNHEGAIIDCIQEHNSADGMLINPGAYAHYSYAIADALRDFEGKKAEAHLSDIKGRESFRSRSVTGEACDKVFFGKKEESYIEALEWLFKEIKKDKPDA